jgi:predicted metal-binding protein
MSNILDMKDDIINNIKNLGISAAAVFPASEIKFDDTFRSMCKDNLCGRYGKNYKCPPDIGTPENLKNETLSYETVILIQTIYPIEDSYDFEGMRDGGEIHFENIGKTLNYIKENLTFDNILALGAGGCDLCKKCGKVENIPCRFPEKAIVSMEAYGLWVSQVCERSGMAYNRGKQTVTYTSCCLF